ncbi:MAG: Calx-beta domain-containing protein [Acidimicrobiales bacterium]
MEVSLTAPSPSTSSWRWTTFDQPDFIDDVLPTTPGVDYVETGGTVTFAPGQTSGHISVTVLGDAMHEATEFVALVAVRDTDPIDFGTVAVGSIHIVDDDLPPTVLPGVAWSTEADGPGAMLHVPVTLSAPSGLDVVVRWTTLDVIGSPPFEARPPGDYTASSGTVVFSSTGSVTRAVVDIPIHDDALPEPDEYVVVSFHDPRGASMGGYWGLGFGGIHDDD